MRKQKKKKMRKVILLLVFLLVLSSYAYSVDMADSDSDLLVHYGREYNSTHWIDMKDNGLEKFGCKLNGDVVVYDTGLNNWTNISVEFDDTDDYCQTDTDVDVRGVFHYAGKDSGVTVAMIMSLDISEDKRYVHYGTQTQNTFWISGRSNLGSTLWVYGKNPLNDLLFFNEAEGDELTDFVTYCYVHTVNYTHTTSWKNGTIFAQKITEADTGNFYNGSVNQYFSLMGRVGDGANSAGGNISDFVMYKGAWNKSDIDRYCSEGISSESDTTPPSINVTSPINNSMNIGSIDINITLDEDGSCSLNSSYWVLSSSTSVSFTFQETTAPNGNYNILIECNDTALNTAYSFLNFTKASPEIYLYSPEDGSYFTEEPIPCIFSFDNFEPSVCLLYSNITGEYSVQDNITSNPYNQTTYYNITYNETRLKLYLRGESVFGNIAYDNSTYKLNGFETDVVLQNSKGKNATLNYTYYFNNQSSYINMTDRDIYTFGDGSSDRPFSVSAWIYPMQTGTGNMIISKREDYHASQREWDLQISGAGNARLQFSLWDSDNDYIQRRYNTPLPSNSWYHVTATYNGNKSASGMAIYLNTVRVDDLDSSSGGYDSMNNKDTSLTIGANVKSDGALGAFFYGYIDEVQLWNISLNQSMISQIYNYGINTTWKIQYQNSTIINESLIPGENYTLYQDSPGIDRGNIDLFINCFDGYDINSTIINIDFDDDFTPPEITLLFPEEYNATWNMDMYVNFTTSEPSDCSVNNTAFSLYDNETYFSFFEDTLDNGYYSLYVSCQDYSQNNNTNNITINYTKDKEFPYIIQFSPSDQNTSTFINEGYMSLIFNASDNIELFSIKVNITPYDDPETVLYYDNLTIEGLYYLYDEVINITAFPNGTMLLSERVCDSHTREELQVTPSNIFSINESLIFDYSGKKIKFSSKDKNDIQSVSYKKQTDRYSIKVKFKHLKKNPEFALCVDEPVIYRPDSGYQCHFVMAENELWFDTEPYKCYREKSLEDDNCFNLFIEGEGSEFEFESIGELNCYEKHITFEIEKKSELKSLGIKIDLDNIGHVLFLFTLVILYIGITFIAFNFRNFGFIGFSWILGLVIGLIIGTLSIYMLLVFMLINTTIFITYVRTGSS